MNNTARTPPMIITKKILAEVKVAVISNAGMMYRTMTRNILIVIIHCITSFGFTNFAFR